jgi:hypothetical protein
MCKECGCETPTQDAESDQEQQVPEPAAAT